jgi:hypothetical protein
VIYIFALLAPLILSLGTEFRVRNYYKYHKLLWKIFIVFSILFVGLRYKVGGDSYYYELYFNGLNIQAPFDLEPNSIFLRFEPLFVFVNAFIKRICTSFYCFQIFHASVLAISVSLLICRSTHYRFLALFFSFILYYWNFSVEVLRESLAIAIFLFAFPLITKKRFMAYYSLCIISILLHSSAIFTLIIPLFQGLRLSKRTISAMIVLFVGASTLYLSTINTFLNATGALGLSKVENAVKIYLGVHYGSSSALLFLFCNSILPLLILLYSKIILRITVKYEPMVLVLILVGIGSFHYPIYFMRLCNYTYPFYAVTLAEFTSLGILGSKYNFNKVLCFVLSAIISVGFFAKNFLWPPLYYRNWLPYYSILSPESSSPSFSRGLQ